MKTKAPSTTLSTKDKDALIIQKLETAPEFTPLSALQLDKIEQERLVSLAATLKIATAKQD